MLCNCYDRIFVNSGQGLAGQNKSSGTKISDFGSCKPNKAQVITARVPHLLAHLLQID